jgi:hypothetical protein
MKCRNCDTIVPEEALRCPNCNTPINTGRLTFSSGKASLDRAVSNSLVRAKSSFLLERADSLDNLSEDIERQGLTALTTADLQQAIVHIKEENSTSLQELENLLSISAEQVSVEGIKLSGLLDGAADDREILKKGLIFLKHGRYSEAVEWWSLNRQRVDSSRQRLKFLLLIMEAFTLSLSGDLQRASLIRKQIKEHSLYEKYRR